MAACPLGRHSVAFCLVAVIDLQSFVTLDVAEAQFLKRLTQVAACGAGGLAGVKIGDKMAEYEARRLDLSPAEAAKRKKAFQIGMGLALCGGGAMIAGTAYSRLSKRGQAAREKEISCISSATRSSCRRPQARSWPRSLRRVQEIWALSARVSPTRQSSVGIGNAWHLP
jgi:hypothetical protein